MIGEIRPEHVRAALMSAIGSGLKFPSVELEEYVANFLNKIDWSKFGVSK